MEKFMSVTLWCPVLLCIILSSGVHSQRLHPFSASDKAAIAKAHNFLRSSVSPPASNMKEMMYSDELEVIAQDYAKKCVYGHSDKKARNKAAPSFDSVGENIFATASTRFVVNLTSYIVDTWGLSEMPFYNYWQNSCQPNEVCVHYTQTVWADTDHVGCGAAFCPAEPFFGSQYEGYDAIYLVCNYGPAGNWRGERPYKTGSSCSDCPTGHHTCSQNLCKVQSGDDQEDGPPVTEQPPLPRVPVPVPTQPPTTRQFCSVKSVNLRRLGPDVVMLYFTGSGPVQSYVCTLNNAYPKPCYSGKIFSNVPSGPNRLKIATNGCGIYKRDTIMQFYMF